MTFALHQSLQILQMSHQELEEWMQAEIEANPLLESAALPAAPQEIDACESAKKPSLREHLLFQAREHLEGSSLEKACWLIDQLDERGWMTENLLEDEERILRIIQTFDPPGIGARNLQESLLLQLQRLPHPLCEHLVQNHFTDLLHGRFSLIQKQGRISLSDLQEALSHLCRLRLRPASAFEESRELTLRPDLTIQEVEGGWLVETGEEQLPSLRLRKEYAQLPSTLQKREEKETVRTWLVNAKWLQRCVARRRDMLKTIGQFLLRKQLGYFREEREIVPIRIQELAALLKVHETTAWRATANKTLACPRGLIPLKQFFSESSRKDPAKELIYSLIRHEDTTSPLTDATLVSKLAEQGIFCSRRTIAKYRAELRLSTAAHRKIRSR